MASICSCDGLREVSATDELVRYLASRLRSDRKSRANGAIVSVAAVDADGQPGDSLRSSLPTDKPIYAEIVAEFADYLRAHVQELADHLAAGDLARIAEIAHSVKGAGGSAGFPAFTDPSRQLEQAAQAKSPTECLTFLAQIRRLSERIEVPELHEVEC